MKQEACSGVIGTNDSHNPLPLTLSLHPVPPSLLILPSLAPLLPWGPFLFSPFFVGYQLREESGCSLTC